MAEVEAAETETTAASDAEEKAAQATEPAPSNADADADAVRKAAEEVAKAPGEKEPNRDIDANRQLFNFYGDVWAGTVGHGGGSSPEQPKPREGKIDAAEIDVMLRYYVEPAGFVEAAEHLESDKVVVLFGGAGIGKCAGAVALLRRLRLSAVVQVGSRDLPDLARHPFAKHTGYVILDRRSPGSEADAALNWRTVRDKVRDAGAYLVVTEALERKSTGPVRYIRWDKPDLAALAAEVLTELVSSEVVAGIVDRLAAAHSIGDLAKALDQIRGGADPDKVIGELDSSGVSDVEQWFTQERTNREIVALAAVALTEGAMQRNAETLRDRLELALSEHSVLPRKKKPRSKDEPMPTGRAVLVASTAGEEPLLEISQGAPGTGRTMRFRKPAYRRQALLALWDRYEAPFWDAVRDWSDDLVREGHHPHIIWGLAGLAAVDVTEIELNYLERWADGQVGWRGQYAAVHLLWSMCYDDATATAALSIVQRWAQRNNPRKRWTAALAFSGMLGVCYPTAAIRGVWDLIVSTKDGSDACYAMGFLFATLAQHTDRAGQVLRHLHRRAAIALEPPKPGVNRNPRLRELTLDAIAAVLRVRDAESGRPSIFLFLHDKPDQAELVTALWVVMLRLPSQRTNALNAMWYGIHSLRRISDEPETDARVFADALVAHLRPDEREPVHRDLTEVDRRMRRSKNEKIVSAVLAEVIERLRPPSLKEIPR